MTPLDAFVKDSFTHHSPLESSQPDYTTLSKEEMLATVETMVTDETSDHSWVMQQLAKLLQLPWYDLDELNISPLVLEEVTESVLHHYPIVPLLKDDTHLCVGVANPFYPYLMELIRFQLQKPIRFALLEYPKLIARRKSLLKNPALSLQKITKAQPNPDYKRVAVKDTIEDPPLIRYVNQLLQQAIDKRASDMHFEPQKEGLTIRLRIDGKLHKQPSPPISVGTRVLSRIKIMAKLDIGEQRLPQDGRFSFTDSETKQVIDCRISTCPTLFGEKIVIRLLNSQHHSLALEQLGLTNEQHHMFIETLKIPHGMILVTGPTGSGKTSTLYSALKHLNENGINISSVEDPVEIQIPGINQVNVQPKIGLGFFEILKVFLRQDPDVMMVGEIRDSQTAAVAVQAAQTGHLVFSTLHTNNAAETLTRLLGMQIPSYNVTASINLIIAQRLLRKLCPHCKKPTDIPCKPLNDQSFNAENNIATFSAQGCKYCTQGYRGRIGVFEFLPITAALVENITKESSSTQLLNIARQEGMMTLKEAAFEKLKAGIIDLKEFRQVG